MSNIPQQPVSLGRYYKVYFNKLQLPMHMIQSIESMEVENSRTDADSLVIIVQDAEKLFLNGDLIVKGTDVIVKMGHPERSRTVFEGKITHIEGDFGPDTLPTLTINCHDMDVEAMDEPKTRTFTNKRVSDVIASMLREAGLKPTVQTTSKVYPKLVQKDESNRDFIKRWAKTLKFHYYKTGRNRYYVGSKPYQNPKPKNIGYKTGGHEIIRATPTFVDTDSETEED